MRLYCKLSLMPSNGGTRMAGPLSAQSVLVSPVQYAIILIPGTLAHLNLYVPDTRTKTTQYNPKPLSVVFFVDGGRLGWLICVQTSRTPLTVAPVRRGPEDSGFGHRRRNSKTVKDNIGCTGNSPLTGPVTSTSITYMAVSSRTTTRTLPAHAIWNLWNRSPK